MKNSIRRQMQVWLMIPLLILLIVSAVCSYVLSMYLSREAYDQALLNSADSIASRIVDDNGKISVERLPRRVKQLLTHDDKDLFVYEIYTENGRLISADQGLPKPPRLVGKGEPAILNYEIIGDDVYRVAVTRGSLPDSSELGHVIIQAGETLNSRKEYRRKLLLGIVVPQMILLSLAVIAIWISIEKGIKPLKTISEVVRRRSPSDLSPIEADDAPDEVRSFLNALNGLFLRVHADMEKQHRFAANAAHQLRTPLAGLKTYIEIMGKNSKDPEFTKMLHQMNDGCDRLIRTVQQLLSLSRAEQGEVLRTYEMIDLNSVVEEALTDVVPESLKCNVELDLNTQDQPVKVLGNAVSLKELTMNLLENAIKYNSAGGHVSVSVKVTDGSNVQLVVEDDGLGIPESERTKVFERFYRVSMASNLEVNGSGLGLSIVSEIARLHNATVTIDSGKNSKGTKFTVTFPPELQSPKISKTKPESEPRI